MSLDAHIRSASRILKIAMHSTVAILVCGIVGCGGNEGTTGPRGGSSPTAPSSPDGPSAQPPITQLQVLDVPSSLRIGQTAQLRAIAAYRDGEFVDLSAKAVWRSSDPQTCSVSPGGIVSARGAGTVTLTAEYASLTARASLPCGFVITAVVHENAPTAGVVLPGVQVVVVGGTHTGMTLTTDALGRVALPPVRDANFRLQFKKIGYDDADYHVEQLPREMALDIAMMPVPGVHIDYTSRCPYYEESFSTHREGRVRVSVTAGAGLGYRGAMIHVRSPLKVWAEAWVDGQTTHTRNVDALLPAGEYTVYVQNLCTPDNRASLEHQR